MPKTIQEVEEMRQDLIAAIQLITTHLNQIEDDKDRLALYGAIVGKIAVDTTGEEFTDNSEAQLFSSILIKN